MRLLSLIFLSVIANISLAQKNEKFSNYINKNAVEIKSIDSDDFSDLQFLKKEIQDKKIIFIGEDKHNCEEIAILRYRLIRFLHKELNFKTICFESGFSNLGLTNLVKDSLTYFEMLVYSLMGYWRVPVHVELFDYVKNNDINIAGIDPNYKSINIHKSAYIALFDNKKIIAEEFYKTDSLFLEFEIIKSNYYSKPKKNIEIERKIDSLRYVLINKYEKLNPCLEIFKSNTLKYLTLKKYIETNMLELTKTISNKKKVNDFFITNERRDKYMDEYLKFIIDSLYPNTKVIVIAHNYHIEKKGVQSINNYRQQPFIDSCYFLGVFSSNFKNNHIANSKRFEKSCMSVSQNIYFVPFCSNVKLNKSYYNYTRNSNMYDSYDGMIYIKNSKIGKLIGYKKGLIRR